MKSPFITPQSLFDALTPEERVYSAVCLLWCRIADRLAVDIGDDNDPPRWFADLLEPVFNAWAFNLGNEISAATDDDAVVADAIENALAVVELKFRAQM